MYYNYDDTFQSDVFFRYLSDGPRPNYHPF